MKKWINTLSPFTTLLLLLSVLLPIGISLNSTSDVSATADNVTISSPTSVSPAYSCINGQVPVTFTVCVTGAASNIDISIFLLSGTTVVGTPSNFLTPSTGAGCTAFTYNLTIPAGTANGTYGVRVDARHPSGTGVYTPSSPSTSSIIVNSTHVPATPSGLTPASGTCSTSTTPTFSWTAVTETSYTFTYNFQLSVNSSFSSTENVTSGLTTNSIAMATALADGTHYWRVQAQDQYGNTSSWTIATSICIDTATPIAPPALLTPANASTIGGSYNPTYSWTASTDTSPCANIRYNIVTYSDAGLTVVADNITGVTNPAVGNPSVSPSAPLGAGTFYWQVRAYDCAGNTSGFTGPWSYTIPASCTFYSISLGTGWNLISLPLCPSSSSSITPTALLALCDNATAVQIIWGYDPSTSWQYYIPGTTGNSLTSIDVSKGYWIQTSSPASIAITGTSCPTPPQSLITATLSPGWNLVGFKSCASMASNVYFPAGLVANISFICNYAGGWNCFAPGVTNLEPTKGYWVYYGGTATGSYGLPCN